MKILQVTHYGTTTNYGAVLQAFALQKALRMLGHEPVLLKADFAFYYKLRKWYRDPHHLLLAWIQKNKNAQEERRHPRNFSQFIQNYMTTTERVYHTPGELQKESWEQFDAMVTGSDQVWGEKMPSDLYFLNFGPKNILRFSYAASTGSKIHSSQDYIKAFRKLLQNFSAVSVRECELLELCRQAEIPATLVPDPVMLFSAADYESFFRLPPKQQKSKKCFIYFVSKNGLFSTDELYTWCAEQDLTPVNVFSQYHIPHSCEKNLMIYPDIPGWVQNIRDAEMVVTDSFHAAVFALIFGKKIVIFPKRSYDARFDMLDRCFGIGPAICRDSFHDTIASQIDSDAVLKKIASFREIGFQFLSQILENAPQKNIAVKHIQ